ncbi:hypothetical protein B7494_g711 [Chlorociboria aeruginascens]|nr:hypothetical protein B7494_g711 [Chlorociboria aeruginascens]
MGFLLRRFGLVVLFVLVSYLGLTALHKHLDPNKSKSAEEREDPVWIATSKSFMDRNACRWIGICGLAHYHSDPAVKPWRKRKNSKEDEESFLDFEHTHTPWEDLEGEGKLRPEDWAGDSRVLKDVPQFVIDAAPLVHLYSGEHFWPSDIADHLTHTTPFENHTTLHMNSSSHTLHNLHDLNNGHRGDYLFMRSTDDVEDRPYWLGSPYNKPVPYGDEEEEGEEGEEDFGTWTDPSDGTSADDKEEWFDPYAPPEENIKIAEPFAPTFRTQPFNRRRRTRAQESSTDNSKKGGYCPAPAILVLVDKGEGILDAFWFYFYSYNLGTTVLGMRFGNHVGDWEHSLIRFHNGVPKVVFFSAHSGGLSYAYKAVEKGQGPGRDGRPVLYSSYGSHAMYATPGAHPYVLPFGMLADVTDRGPLWDPSLNYYAYYFNTSKTHHMDAKVFPSTPMSRDKVSISEDDHLPKPNMPGVLEPASHNPDAPTSWFWYSGHWGDKFYELRDWRQWRFFNQYHYVNGPFGPRFKNLGRSKVCQSRGGCTLIEDLEIGRRKSWIGKRRR